MEQAKQQREVMKTAALTKHLNLTSEQAEKFFPLQNEFHQEAEKVKTAHRETVRKLRTAAKDDRSKYDVDAAIESEAGMKARLIRLEAKFLKDTKDVLTTEQRMKLMTFEQTMKKKIADNAKKNQMQKKDAPNKPLKLNVDTSSGFIREVNGRISGAEVDETIRIKQKHANQIFKSFVRIFPRKVDASLLQGLHSVLGDDFSKVKQIKASYRLNEKDVEILDI